MSDNPREREDGRIIGTRLQRMRGQRQRNGCAIQSAWDPWLVGRGENEVVVRVVDRQAHEILPLAFGERFPAEWKRFVGRDRLQGWPIQKARGVRKKAFRKIERD